MPLIHISSLPFPEPLDTEAVLAGLTERFALEAGVDREHVTATWSYFQPGHYAVASQTPQTQPSDSHPLLVDLLVPDFTTAARVEALLPIVANALADLTGLSVQNVFINCRKAVSGRVWDDGGVARW